MSDDQATAFEKKVELPDSELESLGARLVGFKSRFDRLSRQMRLLIDIEGVHRWAAKHPGGGKGLIDALRDRYPLVVFHGDVGTGKTASAEASASAMAAMLDTDGFMLKLSTRVRGVGHVGQMSTLIGNAFDHAVTLAGKKRFVAMVIDEGDAIAFNRGAERAHHEDRVGVNTLIQKIDDARKLRGRLLIILCTNRYSALDPAILRRTSLIEEFRRPSPSERSELFHRDLEGIGIGEDTIEELVRITGAHDGRPDFTFSDIRTRLLPHAVARAYPEHEIRAEDLLAAAADMEPSPVMVDSEA